MVPEGIIKQIETLLYRFLWGTRDKVKRVNVLQDVKHGGLNMVDVKSLFKSFKAMWIKRLESSDPVIHSLCCHYPISKCRSASIVVTSTVRVNSYGASHDN